MATLTIQLPPQRARTEFNLRRWSELVADPDLAKIEGRVETDRYGHVIMSPAPATRHGRFQARIAILLDRCLDGGEVLTECPISTADGVRAADVAWASADRIRELGNHVCFLRSPEICVEVLSPGNTEAEIREKNRARLRRGRPRGLDLLGFRRHAILPPRRDRTKTGFTTLSRFSPSDPTASGVTLLPSATERPMLRSFRLITNHLPCVTTPQ